MELTQVKAEIERRIAEKDEEFAMVRKNQTSLMTSLSEFADVEQQPEKAEQEVEEEPLKEQATEESAQKGQKVPQQ